MTDPTARRGLTAVCATCLALALAACGGGEPAPSTRTMSQSAASAMTASTTIVQERYADTVHHLYVAYFGRPAETGGMVWWDRQLGLMEAPPAPGGLLARYRGSAQVRAVLDAFANSEESKHLYPGSSAQYIEGVYRNLFNRSADEAGLAWWRSALDSGAITRSEAALMIQLGAQNDDVLCVRNKIAVAHAFYRILNERAQYVLSYTGERNTELVRRMMAKVDARTDLAAFEAVIRATIEEMSGNPVY